MSRIEPRLFVLLLIYFIPHLAHAGVLDDYAYNLKIKQPVVSVKQTPTGFVALPVTKKSASSPTSSAWAASWLGNTGTPTKNPVQHEPVTVPNKISSAALKAVGSVGHTNGIVSSSQWGWASKVVTENTGKSLMIGGKSASDDQKDYLKNTPMVASGLCDVGGYENVVISKNAYISFRKYYEDKGIEPDSTVFGVGPVQRDLRKKIADNTAWGDPQALLAYAKEIDDIYYNSDDGMIVALPGEMDMKVTANGFPVPETSRLGLRTALFIYGSTAQIEGLGMDLTAVGQHTFEKDPIAENFLGGTIMINSDIATQRPDMAGGATLHESWHAGAYALDVLTTQEKFSNDLPQNSEERKMVEAAQEAAHTVLTQTNSEYFKHNPGNMFSPDDYSNSMNEFFAFNSGPSKGYGVVVNIMESKNISEAEATEIVNTWKGEAYELLREDMEKGAARYTPAKLKAMGY